MKVAESQGLRTLWPDEFQHIYTQEEIGQADMFEQTEDKAKEKKPVVYDIKDLTPEGAQPSTPPAEGEAVVTSPSALPKAARKPRSDRGKSRSEPPQNPPAEELDPFTEPAPEAEVSDFEKQATFYESELEPKAWDAMRKFFRFEDNVGDIADDRREIFLEQCRIALDKQNTEIDV